MIEAEFEAKLDAVVRKHVAGCDGFVYSERLSGGASQETYRLRARTADGERPLAMRRAPGGIKVERVANHPGLAVEALLMQSAKASGVPEPEVFYVLEDADGLGDGFIMEWLEGEAL